MTTRIADRPRHDDGARDAPASRDELRNNVMQGKALGLSGTGSGVSGEAHPKTIDRQADRTTFLLYGIVTIAFLVVSILSAMTEAARGSTIDPARTALWDSTSIAVILGLMPFAAWVTDHASPGVQTWPRFLGTHLLGLIAFSAAHVFLMVILRKAIAPIVFGEPYIFTDNLVREAVYEFRKDSVSYAILVMFLVLGRELAQKKAELEAAKASAAPRMLTYRSGGKTIILAASDVLWAKAEGNYAEIHSLRGQHFVRTTLSALQTDLVEAGVPATRVHRSYLAVPGAILEAAATGSGDLKLTMQDGAEIPVSRRHRADLDLS